MTIQSSISTQDVDTAVPRARARFHYPKVAFKRPIPKIAPHVFSEERKRAFAPAAVTGLIALDHSEAMDLPWPATLPTIMARYAVIRKGEHLTHRFNASGEIWYVLRGSGRTSRAGESVVWAKGDAFVLGGGEEVVHSATDDAILFGCTNEPELAFARARLDPAQVPDIRPTLFTREDVEAQLERVHSDPSEEAAGKAVIIVTEAMQDRLCATPSLSGSFNTLEAGGDQRAHRHNSSALTLSVQGRGVHSYVDGQKVDWEDGLVMLTPPGAPHSHHNRGDALMFSFVVQDSPLHAQMRTTNFQFVD